MKSKALFLLLLITAATNYLKAQTGNITVVSEDSLKFTLFVNSVRQNNPPDFWATAKNISGSNIPITISFQKSGLPTVSTILERSTNDGLYSVLKNEKGRIVVVPRTKPFTPPVVVAAVVPTTSTTTVVTTTTTTTTNGVPNNTNNTTSQKTAPTNSLDVKANSDGKITDIKSSKAGEFHDDGNTQGYKSANGKFSVSSNVRVVPVVPGLPGPLPTADEVQQFQQATTPPPAQTAPAQGLPPGTFTFYSNDGYNFTLYMQGIKINNTPQSNVVVPNVTEGFLQVRVEFEDPAIPTIKKSFMRMGRDCGYAIERDSKGFFVLRLRSNVGDLSNGQKPTSTSSSNTTTYNPNSAPVYNAPPPPPAVVPLKATIVDGKIKLNDGRSFTLFATYSYTEQPHIKVNILDGAKVTITWDDGLDTYNSETPINYIIQKPAKYEQMFKITIDEGGPDKTWFIKGQTRPWWELQVNP